MSRNLIAMLPGTFDPPTLGHINIIERASRLFDKLYVVVAHNINKQCLFSPEERVAMLCHSLSHLSNVIVDSDTGLSVDYARRHDVSVMVRGVRSELDFSYEIELAMTNNMLYPELEIVFMPTDQNYLILRSSQIKEMVAFGADISRMVPPIVLEKLEEKKKTGC